MQTSTWTTLVACVGQLALVLLAALPGARSPLAVPLALLVIDLFAWNFAALAHQLSGAGGWRWLDLACSPLTAPLALHFLLTFSGQRRRFMPVLLASYAAFGALGLAAIAAAFTPALAHFVQSPAWAVCFLVGLVPLTLFMFGLLRAHLARASQDTERVRTRLLIAALLILAGFGSTELFAHQGLAVPRLGSLGSLVSTAILSVVALRWGLLDQRLSASTGLYAFVMASVAVVGYAALFQIARGNLALLSVLLTLVTVFVVFVTRRAVAVSTQRRQRLEQLATLGRFSAQMAHDLKNPLAALKGAAQFLQEENRQGRSGPHQGEFVDLMLEQIDRLHQVIDGYGRLGRIEPARAAVDLNELVKSVAGLQKFATTAQLRVDLELATDLPAVTLDRELISSALENLVQNALEAMPGGGTLTLRTRLTSTADGEQVAIDVADTGQGMDPRARERAFDDFFTTKATGSGMGLSFVRRVVEAHGGEVHLSSREGRGTRVTLSLPLDPGRDAGPDAAGRP